MLAGLTSTPELALDKDEAHNLAVAAAEVAKFYPTTIDPKALAWFNLMLAAGVVYGPRVYLIRERLKAERAKDVTPGSAGNPGPAFEPPLTVQPAPPATDQAGTPNASSVPFKMPPGTTFPGMG
jgi:hypothetical protein